MVDGNVDVRYEALDVARNFAISETTSFTVENAPYISFPAPFFPDYPRADPTRQQIMVDGGVLIEIGVELLKPDDLITLTWSGYSDLGELMPDASRVLLNRNVNADDFAASEIVVWADMSTVLASGPDGTGVARYSILRGPPGEQVLAGLSRPARLLVRQGADFLLAAVTSGATVRLDQRPYLGPANRMWLGAHPFTEIAVTLTGGNAMFDVVPPADSAHVVTDVRGLAQIDIFVNGPSQADISTSAGAQLLPPFKPLTSVVTSVFSRSYLSSADGSILYSCRDFLISNGDDQGSVWVSSPSVFTNIPVSVSGSALINGYGNPAYQSLTNLDCSCTINIVNLVEEQTNVGLGDTGTGAQFTIQCKKTPFSS